MIPGLDDALTVKVPGTCKVDVGINESPVTPKYELLPCPVRVVTATTAQMNDAGSRRRWSGNAVGGRIRMSDAGPQIERNHK